MIQGLLLGKMVAVFDGMMLSTQNEVYEVTVSTCSLLLYKGERSLWIQSIFHHPLFDGFKKLLSPPDYRCVCWSRQDGVVVSRAARGDKESSVCIWHRTIAFVQGFPQVCGACHILLETLKRAVIESPRMNCPVITVLVCTDC